MEWKNNETRYGMLSMLLHWSSAALIFALLPIGLYMTGLPDGDDKWGLYDLHKSLGFSLFLILLLRIVWKRLNLMPALPDNLNAYEQKLASATHYLLYAMMAILPITGYIDSSAGGYHFSFFGWFDMPMVIDKNKALAKISTRMHEYTAYALIAVVLLHAAAALKHHMILKDNVLLRMLPGRLRN